MTFLSRRARYRLTITLRVLYVLSFFSMIIFTILLLKDFNLL